jgi:hypothetical protein
MKKSFCEYFPSFLKNQRHTDFFVFIMVVSIQNAFSPVAGFEPSNLQI